VPEGGGPLNEDVLSSAKRELKEETGLIANEWKKIGELYLSNSVTDEKGVIYVARQLVQEEAMPEDTEQLIVKKVPFEEAYRMVEDGLITDGLAITALLKVKILLLEGKL
jgi:8-oxo-dGTP pyrophosphatase MutT (NUDIX family)